MIRTSSLALGILALGAVVAARAWTQKQPTADAPATTPPQAAAPAAAIPQAPWIAGGHVVLVVEGDARGMRVTHAQAKADAYQGAKPGLANRTYEVEVQNAAGVALGTYPLDLSHFDLDPQRVGQPLRVEGDVVRNTQVTALTNVPTLPGMARIAFRKLGQPWGQPTTLATVTAGNAKEVR